ncbi:sensor histidine kinase, partial [Victivallis vadensis]
KYQRLLANLLDNAIKFTPSGGTVSVRLEPGDSEFTLRISDTGCGIPPEARSHIFERFYRSDSSRSLPGNGLGLSLVKAIVSVAGGTIEVESEVNRGTTFLVTLPRWRQKTKMTKL